MKRPSYCSRTLAAVAALVAALLASPTTGNHFILPCDIYCARGGWFATQSMRNPREMHSATLLQDGRVLVAGGGGTSTGVLDSAEVYDPITETWTPTAPMTGPRSNHTATLLADGRVLVAGGITSTAPPDWGVTATAEIYDPATGTWTRTGSMTVPRFWFDAAALLDGRVLVAGGAGGVNIYASAEIYDPRTGSWSVTDSLHAARYGHTLTTLDDGTVLAVRGSDSGDLENALRGAELYDPRSGSWTSAGDSGAASVLHTATRLPNGKVLVTGGNGGGVGRDAVFATTMLYDPASRTWSHAGDLPTPMYGHSAAVLGDGNVLVAGGEDQAGAFPVLRYLQLPVSAVFDSAAREWKRTTDIRVPRSRATMTALQDGTVLLVGGVLAYPDTTTLPNAERFMPAATQRENSIHRR